MSSQPNVLEAMALEADIRRDPVKWAMWKLKDIKGNPWNARWYQRDLLHDVAFNSVNKLAVRMGRRVGKTETMCVYMLWRAMHNPNERLLVATPYENQVRLIFMRLKELINSCDELKESVVRDVSNPYIIEFANGTAIMGFTVGATSGNAGASIRGQRADFLFLDEVDFMSREGVDATIAITYEDPKRIGVWASSTPIGKRDFFYEICTKPETGYKPYHYPSTVNPDFDEEMEGEFRATMTEQGYIHEVLAEFGEETMGVFGKAMVERARDQFLYTYRDLNVFEQKVAKKNGYKVEEIVKIGQYTLDRPAPYGVRILAADWDKYGAATQIVGLVYDTDYQKLRVEGRWEIPRGDFTFDTAVKKIIELDEIHNYNAIMLDAGSGEMQIETLKLHGKENPHTNLHKKVHRVQFSMNVEVPDPITGEIDKKKAKHFMVNQTAMLLERDRILVSPFDNMIWQQFMDYRVVKITQSGDPVYTSENEHALDALMLGVLGFAIHYPQITKTMIEFKPATHVGTIQHQEGGMERLMTGTDDPLTPMKSSARRVDPAVSTMVASSGKRSSKGFGIGARGGKGTYKRSMF